MTPLHQQETFAGMGEQRCQSRTIRTTKHARPSNAINNLSREAISSEAIPDLWLITFAAKGFGGNPSRGAR